MATVVGWRSPEWPPPQYCSTCHPRPRPERAQGVEDRGAALIDDQLAALDYPGDFRGSSEYRRALARTLSRRAMEEISR